jgi:uncharacterized membrane protein YphA (DoxX/SURF4 family)
MATRPTSRRLEWLLHVWTVELHRAAVRAGTGAVFVLSGAGKLLSPPDPTLYAEFPLAGGLSRETLGLLIVGLSVAEIVAGALFLLGSSVRLASHALLLLLALFTIAVATNAGNDRFAANCGCFGALVGGQFGGSSPLGRLILLVFRNGLLSVGVVVGATVAPVDRSLTEVRRALSQRLIVITGATVVAMLAVAVVRADRERTRAADLSTTITRSRLVGLPIPDASATTLDGRVATLAKVAETSRIVLCVAAKCPRCRNSIPGWRRLEPVVGRMAYFFHGDLVAARAFATEQDLDPQYVYSVATTRELARLGISTFPGVLRLDSRGNVVWRSSAAIGPTNDWLDDVVRLRPADAALIMATAVTDGAVTARYVESVTIPGVATASRIQLDGQTMFLVSLKLAPDQLLVSSPAPRLIVLLTPDGRVQRIACPGGVSVFGTPFQIDGELDPARRTRANFILDLLPGFRERLDTEVLATRAAVSRVQLGTAAVRMSDADPTEPRLLTEPGAD